MNVKINCKSNAAEVLEALHKNNLNNLSEKIICRGKQVKISLLSMKQKALSDDCPE